MKRLEKYLHDLWHLLHPEESCGETTIISDVALQRQMLYDAFQHPERVAALMEMSPISPDVSEMELRAHTARMEEILPIFPLLMGQADFLAEAAANLQLDQLDEPGAEQVAAVHLIFNTIVKGCLVAAVSSAVALGVLEVRAEVTSGEQ